MFAAAFVMKMPIEVMNNEKPWAQDEFYDYVLVSSLIVCVPLALVCAVATKLWRANRAGLLAVESGPKAAFDRCQFGLASAQDRRELRQYFGSLAMVDGDESEESDDDNSFSTTPSFRNTWAGTGAAAGVGDGGAARVSRPPAVERDTNAMSLSATAS